MASLIAFLCSQTLDVWIFSRLRKATNEKHLWLRNNVSTCTSQLIDSAVFVGIAFYGVFPIGEMIIGQWIVKMLIAALDTSGLSGCFFIKKRSKSELIFYSA